MLLIISAYLFHEFVYELDIQGRTELVYAEKRKCRAWIGCVQERRTRWG